jgi:DNA-binding transcriptional LysR family regulator
MAVVVAPEDPLANAQDMPAGDVLRYRQLLIHWGSAFHAYVESLRQMSPAPGPLIRLPLAGALPMARQLDTVTFMPRRLVTASGLAEVGVKDFSFSWDIALLTRPGRSLTHLEQAFVDIVDEVWQRSGPSK